MISQTTPLRTISIIQPTPEELRHEVVMRYSFGNSVQCKYIQRKLNFLGTVIGHFMVVNSDKNSTEWVESKRVQTKLDDANITSTALNKWKDENKELANLLLFSHKNNIYEANKQFILIMKGERDGKLSNQLTEFKDQINQKETGPPEKAPPDS